MRISNRWIKNAIWLSQAVNPLPIRHAKASGGLTLAPGRTYLSMMRLTQATNYSVRTLLYCAANADTPSRVSDIAASFGMSETHLFKILKVLVDADLVRTIRGRNGGLMLARPAAAITVGEVVRAAEESFILADCFDPDGHDCPLLQNCEYNRILREALTAFFAVLDRYTIADVALYAYTHVAGEGGFDLGPRPAIRAWIERVSSQPRHIPITRV